MSTSLLNAMVDEVNPAMIVEMEADNVSSLSKDSSRTCSSGFKRMTEKSMVGIGLVDA